MHRSLVRSCSLLRHMRRLPRALSYASIASRTPTCSSSHSFCRNYADDAAQLAKNVERFEFQAETKSLLDIVAKSLYSDQEVFIRELVSNASDALEKRRCAHLVEGGDSSIPYEIKIFTDEKARLITFEDNGIGMDRNDLTKCLGTIARSGSKEFVEEHKKAGGKGGSAESIIGQFGVGFYSAFMVADEVTVSTRKEGADLGFIWKWNGSESYTIQEDSSLPVGTRVQVQLKPGDAAEFAKPQRVIDVINKYSYFITLPITVNGDRVNTLNAIWTMNPKDVTSEMHETFFRQIAKTHLPHLAGDRPQYTIHYKADAPLNVRALLYVPSHNVSQLEFATDAAESGVSLYARRVLIKANAKELLPRYLRFLIGVVDSEDVPLNLSREMLQMDSVLTKLKRTVTDKVVSYFVSQMKKDRVKYSEFYKGYSLYFKEGVCLEHDQNTKEQIASLLMFESSNLKPGVKTSLAEYVERMQEGQTEIFYLFAPNRQLAESSPYFEMFKSQNREVLFAYDAADEVVFLSLPQFKLRQMKSVDHWAQTYEGSEKTETTTTIRDSDKKELLDWMKSTLGSVKVYDIKGSHRASEHPCVLNVRAEPGMARHLMRIGQVKDMEHLVFLQPTLNVNLSHPIISALVQLHKTKPDVAQLVAEQIYDNALVTCGLLKDPSNMVERVNKLLGNLLKPAGSTILTP